MAYYAAKLDVILSGLRELSLLEDRLEKINGVINTLNKTPIALNVGGAGPQRDISGKLSKEVNDYVRLWVNGEKEIGKSINAVSQQQAAFQELLQETAMVQQDPKAKNAVKNLAQAWADTTLAAEQYNKKLNDIQREALGLQPQDVRDAEVARRQAFVTSGRRSRAEQEQTTYQEQINKNLRTDVLYQRLKLGLILDQSDALLKQDSLTARLAKKAAQSGGAGKFGENLALGVGFPLLFGGGAGSVLGSAVGSFFGSGFGGQILGGALGQALDQAVAAAGRLGNELALVGDSFSQLREDGVNITAELEKQVRAAKELGNTGKAQRLLQGAVAAQTGDIGGVATGLAGASVNELQKAWNGVTKAVQATLGALAGPFVFALTFILKAVQGVFVLFNLMASSVSNLIGLFPPARKLGEALYESSLKGTKEYENQLAELDKQIKSEAQLVDLAKVRTSYLEKSLGKTAAQQEILNKEADAAERLKKFEQEIAAFRASAPSGTSELRQKAVQQEAQMRFKFVEEEKQEALKNAQSIYQAVQDNNKKVADAQRQYQQQYADMVRQAAREQADIDLQAARTLQDARMRMREQDLDYVQKTRQEELRTQELLNKQAQLNRSLSAALSTQPEQAELINTVQTAVETWRTGRLSVEQEAKAQQEKAQLEYSKAQIQIERYKYDNALRIARANENSQLTISRVNADMRRQNEQASKNEYERQLAGVKAILTFRLSLAKEQLSYAKPLAETQGATPEQKQALKTAEAVYNEYSKALIVVNQLASKLQVNKLQQLGPAPTLTDTSGNATAAQRAASDQLLVYQNQITALEKINGLKQQDLELAKALLAPGADYLGQFNSLINQQEKQRKYQQEYLDLLRAGISPELAQQLATINQMEDALLTNLSTLISTIEAYNDPGLDAILDKLIKIRESVGIKAEAARAGVKPEVAPGQKLQEFIARTQVELQDLEGLAVRVAGNITDAIANSMSDGINGLIEGTQSAQEVFANFLKNVADILMQEATRMIAQYIGLGIARAFAFGGSTGSAGNAADSVSQFNAAALQYRAEGGPVSAGSPYVVGERGPELFVPGRSGTIVPNNKMGGDNMSVVVNVDAKGTSVQGNDQTGNQLGRVISAAVQQELIKQKRPGGLLA